MKIRRNSYDMSGKKEIAGGPGPLIEPISSADGPSNAADRKMTQSSHAFDFQKFLAQLRHRSADPVARYLRSFLAEFGRKKMSVQEQSKVIHDFVFFISEKILSCSVWQSEDGRDLENAIEGMEKLIMNRLYCQTFSPLIENAHAGLSMSNKSSQNLVQFEGTDEQQNDLERDKILHQKTKIYGWLQAIHLDIPPMDPNGKRLLRVASAGPSSKRASFVLEKLLILSELEKINAYRAPRDKIVCILNCCKVVVGMYA